LHSVEDRVDSGGTRTVAFYIWNEPHCEFSRGFSDTFFISHQPDLYRISEGFPAAYGIALDGANVRI
jgi:hypothetical protein